MEASPLLNNAAPPHKSTASKTQPNDNRITITTNAAAAAAAANVYEDSSAQHSMTISRDGNEKSSSRASIRADVQHVKTDNHQDSSIKLKRCKHGRIIIKDLSKKKLAQPRDNCGITVANKQNDESNNNHIIRRGAPINDNETESPGVSHVAPSPATPPSNGDSASSDIYDPEGPIIPISPCDSPPISPLSDIKPTKKKPQSANNEKNEDDVPSSAVQLNQQEKYLQKLNRQERVIEEVKVALRPFYQNRSIGKEQYKDVLRRAVPKICHSKNGEINPIKIRALVDAYVKKMKRN
jgi:hypothetical protein